MKTVLLITDRFPFSPGEQFLEPELDYWVARSDVKLIVLPVKRGSERRSLPASVSLNLQLSERPTLWEKCASVARAFFSTALLCEVRYLLGVGILRPATARAALHALYSKSLAEKRLRSIVNASSGGSIVYTYWNSPVTYAATCLRREGAIEKVVTRAHGFDLYEERRAHEYMPYVRQYLNQVDHVCAISKAGANYLVEKYKIKKERVGSMALGVALPASLVAPSSPGTYNVLTLSSCVQVKRIDKVIEALALLSKRLPSIKINWFHIGDGPLRKELEGRAHEVFAGSNVTSEFLGGLAHEKVFEFFETNKIDVLLNASDSEGIPVSIMEAMSYGVPVVAPDVGGVGEIVTHENGDLLPKNPTPEAISDALVTMFEPSKTPLFRKAARGFIEDHYFADKNFGRFVEFVVS